MFKHGVIIVVQLSRQKFKHFIMNRYLYLNWGGAPIKQHDQSAVPDNNMMRVSDC